ncbi:MAG: hypothetical protein ACK2U3_02960 [Anaerolineales bacterium]
MHIELDSAMQYCVAEEGAEPLIFLPQINWEAFREPNIINAY